MNNNCYCGNSLPFSDCCEIYIKGDKAAPTAEALMRSRYSAYAVHAIDYLLKTTHISQRKYHSKKDIEQWAVTNQWLKLEVIKATESTVEFKAYFLDATLQSQIHHEKSTFKLQNGNWFYVDGKFY
ncbi:YchJ family protein [Flavobacterium cerinum]|uniref:YchJ family protein n=1 Tax=Flavobacterium cerinum TaxID=2502784 RepID=A0ABY5IR56_9FLAO|nr:YchJ family protein [Flavobacterium cerinum]UUC44027.1 YchJ family protein [Flavobacterium cerinum]